MRDKTVLAYFGHHKCATVWIRNIMTAVCNNLSLKIENVDSPGQFGNDLETFIDSNQIDFLIFANADIDFVKELKDFKGFHVVRDPRDLAVSSYFSHLHSHPTDVWPALERHREKLKSVSKEEGLFMDMEFIRHDVFLRMLRWDYSIPNVLELKMEDLTTQSFEKYYEILKFLDLIPKISTRKLDKIIHNNRFSVMAGGRKPGEENVHHHFRKGVAGDWINHFTDDHKKYFKDKYNDLLVRLGYEKDENW